MKVLAIGAHPDDIEIFMLGLLMSCKARNDDIILAIATDGGAGNVLDYPDLKNVRKMETTDALKSLAKPHFFDFPDGNLFFVREAAKSIKEFIESIKPDLIVTHSPEDYHPDHRALSEFVNAAAGFICPILYADCLMGINFIPEYYIDITQHFEKKSEAILKHKSQDPEKFLKATEILNRFRSAQCNASDKNYAEAYRWERRFPYSDIRDLLPPSPKINQFYKSLNNSMI